MAQGFAERMAAGSRARRDASRVARFEATARHLSGQWMSADLERRLERARQSEMDLARNVALKNSPAFRRAEGLSGEIHLRAMEFIASGLAGRQVGKAEIRKLLAPNHISWLRSGAYALASQLFEEEENTEIRTRCNQIFGAGSTGQMYDRVGRYAMCGATGLGKTVLSACLALVMLEKLPKAEGRAMPMGTRGMLYCAGSIDLLEDMVDLLRIMGADMGRVGIYKSHPDGRTPSNSKAELKTKPIVLVSHQLVKQLTTDGRKILQPDMEKPEITLPELASYRGVDRIAVWDEAFQTCSIGALRVDQLLMAVTAALTLPIDHKVEMVSNAMKTARLPLELAQHYLLKLSEGGVATPEERRVPISFSETQKKGIRYIAQQLKSRRFRQAGPACVLEQFLQMSEGFIDAVAKATGEDDDVTYIVQPIPRIDHRLKRVVVLDASFAISDLRRSEPTVEESVGSMNFVNFQHYPKVFDDVLIHFIGGPHGRQRLEGNQSIRTGLIRRQVDRIVEHVPDGEPFLICTFKEREKRNRTLHHPELELDEQGLLVDPLQSDPVDWLGEVKAALEEQGVKDWQTRARFLTWGQHYGRNAWRDCRYAFVIGVMQRAWGHDLRLTMKAVRENLREQDDDFITGCGVFGVTGEMAADLQQLVGRLHCRNTVRKVRSNGDVELAGVSGATRVWVEMTEPVTGVPVNPAFSPLCDRLRAAMPGVQLLAVSDSGRVSTVETKTQRVARLMMEHVDGLPVTQCEVTVDQVLKAIRPEVADCSVPTIKEGMRMAKAALGKRDGADRWVTLGTRSRRLVRPGR